MAGLKEYKWIWKWGDMRDPILDSFQWFRAKNECQLDGVRHFPVLRQEDLKGRTGVPKLDIIERPVKEYQWVVNITDKNNVCIGEVAFDHWYETLSECLLASKKLIPQDVLGMGLEYEVDYMSRIKQS